MEKIGADYITATLIVIFLAIGVHEFSHAKFADMAGDPTPRAMGRVTLNLFKHFDPFGVIMILITTMYGFGIGWGKPVMVNPSKMNNPRWDHFVSVAAGPVSNLVQATLFGLAFRFLLPTGALGGQGTHGLDLTFTGMLVMQGVIVNLSLAFFNLIPFGPLDGHWLIGAFMPDKWRFRWYRFSATTGSFILLALILMGQLSDTRSPIEYVLGPPVMIGFRLLTGM
jgi:Zn-dependent protease